MDLGDAIGSETVFPFMLWGRIMLRKRFAYFVCATMLVVCACASESEKRDNHYAKGTAYVEDGRVKEAMLEFKNSVKIDPGFTLGWVEIGNISVKQGDSKGAFSAFSKVVENDPGHSDAHFNLAKLFMLARQKVKARQHIDIALGKEPDNVEYLLIFAALMAGDGDDAKALGTYAHVTELSPADARPYRGKARLLTKRNDFAGAERALRRAMALSPDAIRPHLDLVNLFNNSRQYDKAEVELKAIVQKNSDNSALYLILGDFYTVWKKYAEAEAAYLDAIAKKPQDLLPVVRLAAFYVQRNEYGKAEVLYEKGLKMEPEDHDIVMTTARFYANRGRLKRSEGMLDDLLKKNPGYLPAMTLKGEIAFRQRHFDSAVVTLSSVIAEDSKSVEGHYLRGISYMALKSNDLARKDVLRALELNDKHFRARVALAELYLKDREYFLAKEEIEKALAKRPYLYKANLVLGDVLAATGEFDEALQILDILMKQEPENPIAFFRSGLLSMAVGDLSHALETFVKARAIDPKLMDVFGAMVRCHAMNKAPEKALALCRDQLKVIDDSPASVSVVYGLMGGLYIRAGDWVQAEKAYTLSIEHDPNATKSYYGLVAVYQRLGNTEKVVAQLREMAKHNPDDPMPHVVLGIMHEGAGEIGNAKVSYRKALDIKQDNVAAANNLAYILADANEKIDEALELARTARARVTDDPNVMDTLGLVYYKKGLYESAISEFKGSLEQLAGNATVNYHLGLALHANGDVDKARKFFEKALEISQEFKGADEAREILARK